MDEYIFCKYDPALEQEYGWAVCTCTNNNGYGIRIKRKAENHYFQFKCPNCGTEIRIVLTGTNPDCSPIDIT